MTSDRKVGAMLSPEQIAAAGTEHAHQAALFQWVNTVWKHPKRHMLFAVPNGGDRQAHVGASMKAEGVKSGVPDMCWPIMARPSDDYSDRRGQVFGLYLELKVPGRERKADGGLSGAQIKWLGDLRAEGYATAVAFGWQAAAWVLAMYAQGEARSTFTALNVPVDGLDVACWATPMERPPYEEWLRGAGQWYGGD